MYGVVNQSINTCSRGHAGRGGEEEEKGFTETIFPSHLIAHTHTLRYLRYFQTCCLGDHSLFRCVVKETKMERKAVQRNF